MMHVLVSALSCNASIGSEALVGFKTAEAIATRHEVTLVSAKPCQGPEGAEIHELDIGPCSLNDIEPWALFRFELHQRSLLRRMNQRKPFDVLHRVTPSALGMPGLLPELGCPLVLGPLIATDPLPSAFEPMMRRPVASSVRPRWHPRRILRGLQRRLAGQWSDRDRQLFRAHRILIGNRAAMARIPGALHPRCRSITYAGVEHDHFVPGPEQQPHKGPLRLLSVGRMIPYKGVELLLRCIAAAVRTVDLRLRIIGSADPAYARWCHSLAVELGIADKVSFEPPRPRMDLPALYQEADVFCFTTLCDTYGVALLEAMSCGCAVIVSDVAGAGEIVNGTNGIKIPLTTPEDYIQQFAAHVAYLDAHQEELRRLGNAARQHVIEHHDWPRTASRLFELYAELEDEPALIA